MCSWTADLSSLLALLVPLAVDQSPAAWASLLGSSQHGNRPSQGKGAVRQATEGKWHRRHHLCVTKL